MLGILPLLAACAGVAPNTGRATPVPSKAVLVFADWEAPGTFDPRPPTTGARLRDDTLVYGRLWIPDPAGRLLPDLAAEVPRPDGDMLTVNLRPGLRWSDGSPLTAADVVRSYALQGVGAVALSATRLRVQSGQATSVASVFVAPPQADGRVASGPFRLVAADSGELRFTRNPHYHGRQPYLAEIDELVSSSHDAMEEAAQAGEVDFLPHLGPADLAAHFGPLRTVVTISERNEVLVPAGIDARLLAALSAATDRQALVTQAFGGAGKPLGLPPQVDLARHFLAGRTPTIALQTVCDDPLRASEAAALAAQWSQIGARVTTSCAAISQLTSTPPTPRLALYSVLAGQTPADAISLLQRPALRAVSTALHGFEANDTVGTDLWDVSEWWLQ